MLAILSTTLGLHLPPPHPAATAVLSRRGALFAGLAAASGLALPAAFADEAALADASPEVKVEVTAEVTAEVKPASALEQQEAVASILAPVAEPELEVARKVVPTKECLSGCFKECSAITKSGPYCAESCDAYCSEGGATGTDDVLRSDVTGQTAEKKDCGTYKTDKARAWCAGENERTLAALRANDIDKNLGLFGDSGVTYGKGLEDLFATAFGATRQSQPLSQADIGSFADEIGAAATRAGRK